MRRHFALFEFILNLTTNMSIHNTQAYTSTIAQADCHQSAYLVQVNTHRTHTGVPKYIPRYKIYRARVVRIG